MDQSQQVNPPPGSKCQISEQSKYLTKTRLPWNTLSARARKCDILPSLEHNSLDSVEKLVNAGYYILVMPGGKGV